MLHPNVEASMYQCTGSCFLQEPAPTYTFVFLGEVEGALRLKLTVCVPAPDAATVSRLFQGAKSYLTAGSSL